VDRQFNPRRYDAAQAIQSFSARLRDQLDLDTLTSELVAVVQQTMQPTQGIHLAPLRIGPNTEAPTRGQLPSGLIHVEEANILGTDALCLDPASRPRPDHSLLSRSASCFALVTALSAWQLSTLD
jgi:hypothetical protein